MQVFSDPHFPVFWHILRSDKGINQLPISFKKDKSVLPNEKPYLVSKLM